jgi:serine/threonine-protein kinase
MPIVTRCLRKSPADRFQSMTEVKASLAAVRPSEAAPSIAVLPFANMSGDKEQEYFSDGLTEEIINVLAQIPGLKVTARTSAFAFRGKEQDITRIAEALHVRAILEGSVRKAGDRIRVTADLINAADGYHIWSQRYDRQLEDVFAVQDEMAAAIAAALRVKLSVEPAAARRHTPTIPAYEAYLRGLHYVLNPTPESFSHGKQHLERAIALDPGFALPHATLGRGYFARAYFGLMPAREAMPLVRRVAQTALDIDSSLPEAQSSLGLVAAEYDYDWNLAEHYYQLAMAHEPVPALVRFSYAASYLLVLGRSLDATQQMELAVQDDPLNARYHVMLGLCLEASGKDGSEELRRAVALGDDYFLLVLGWIHASRGRIAEALAAAERAYSLAPWSSLAIGVLAGVLMLSGDRDRAQGPLDKLGSGQAYGAPHGLAIFHLLCSDIDRAADWVEKAIEERDPSVLQSLRQPYAQPLRSSRHWPKLAKLMKLPPQAL